MDTTGSRVRTSIRHLTRKTLSTGVVQVSLDLKTVDDALKMASVAVAAGADWLEIGTPLALSQGTAAVKELRNAFPAHPLVADLKIMDGGYGEAALYANAGADAVVVMSRGARRDDRARLRRGPRPGPAGHGRRPGRRRPGRRGQAHGGARRRDGAAPHRARPPERPPGAEAFTAHRPAGDCRRDQHPGPGGRRPQHRPGRVLPEPGRWRGGVRRPAGDQRREVVDHHRRRPAQRPDRRGRAGARARSHLPRASASTAPPSVLVH